MGNRIKTLFSITASIIMLISIVVFLLNFNASNLSSNASQTPENDLIETKVSEPNEENLIAEEPSELITSDNSDENNINDDQIVPNDNQEGQTEILTIAEHLDGYIPTQVTFVPWEYTPDASDPDLQGYDQTRELDTISPREAADLALQCLYDMFGYNVDNCYAIIIFETEGRCDIAFGYEKNVANNSFYDACIDTATRTVIGMDMYYNQNKSSSLPTDNLYRFNDIENATYEEIAQYYYDNSSYGDRRPIVNTKYLEWTDGNGNITNNVCRLFVESGEFYEVFFNSNERLPSHYWGPYPVGFEH